MVAIEKYILILTIMLSACAGTYKQYSVATQPYASDIGVIESMVNNNISIDYMSEHELVTDWNKVYITSRWEYHYRFLVNFDSKIITAQCLFRDQSRSPMGGERPWKFKICNDNHILKLVRYDLDVLLENQ